MAQPTVDADGIGVLRHAIGGRLVTSPRTQCGAVVQLR